MAQSSQTTDWQPIPFERPHLSPAPSLPERERDFQVSSENMADRFALRQLTELVQKVFLPGHRGGNRQVVFSSLESSGVRPWLSARIGRLLAHQVAESVCLVELDRNARLSYELTGQSSLYPHSDGNNDLTRKVEQNLWLCPAERFLRQDACTPRGDLLRLRLGRLRREFGYLVIHAPALGMGDDAVLLGQLSQGLVLVLEANTTRRAAAVRASQMLRTSGVTLLGTVLDQRTFPVPEYFYRRA